MVGLKFEEQKKLISHICCQLCFENGCMDYCVSQRICKQHVWTGFYV